jgi:hypothetical protein
MTLLLAEPATGSAPVLLGVVGIKFVMFHFLFFGRVVTAAIAPECRGGSDDAAMTSPPWAGYAAKSNLRGGTAG